MVENSPRPEENVEATDLQEKSPDRNVVSKIIPWVRQKMDGGMHQACQDPNSVPSKIAARLFEQFALSPLKHEEVVMSLLIAGRDRELDHEQLAFFINAACQETTSQAHLGPSVIAILLDRYPDKIDSDTLERLTQIGDVVDVTVVGHYVESWNSDSCLPTLIDEGRRTESVIYDFQEVRDLAKNNLGVQEQAIKDVRPPNRTRNYSIHNTFGMR